MMTISIIDILRTRCSTHTGHATIFC